MLAANKVFFFFTNNKRASVLLFILLLIILLSNCVSKTGTDKADIRGEAYAGSAQCKNCHQQVYDSYVHAAHFNTSANDLPQIVKESFEKDKNVFKFNDSVEIVMEKSDSGYYQSYYSNGKKLFSQRFDITVGSGRKAQTYLYYNDRKKISQLPISYFTSQNSWANSPGFPEDHPKFDRNVPSYCMGCHSSFIEVKQTYTGVVMQEEFEKGMIVYGIDCERCHGPARDHVKYQTNHPQAKESKFMTKISTLNRTQQTDMCALCHSGFRDVQQSLFNFKPGDNLVNYYIPEYGRIDTANLDVHGNQTQLMLASKCYQLSNNLTCNSCHNVHVKERDDLSALSQRCITCHKQVEHSFINTDKKFTDAIQHNCIDCHMPLKASAAITMLTNQKKDVYPDYIRTHLITIYKEDTKKFLDSLKKVSKAN